MSCCNFIDFLWAVQQLHSQEPHSGLYPNPSGRNGWVLVSQSVMQPNRLMLITCVHRTMISLRVKSISAAVAQLCLPKYWALQGERSMTTPQAGAWSNYTYVAASIHLASWHAHKSINPFMKPYTDVAKENRECRTQSVSTPLPRSCRQPQSGCSPHIYKDVSRQTSRCYTLNQSTVQQSFYLQFMYARAWISEPVSIYFIVQFYICSCW